MDKPQSPAHDFPGKLLEKGIVRAYEPGEIIDQSWEKDDSLLLLLSGEAWFLIRDNGNGETLVEIFRAGEIMGRADLVAASQPLSQSALKARERCEVLELRQEDFETLLRDEPGVGLFVNRMLTRKVAGLRGSLLRSARNKRALRSLISRKEHIFPDYAMGEYVSQRLSDNVRDLSQSGGPVLIIGESGVGKEFIAHSIFRAGPGYREVFLLLDLFRQPQEVFSPEQSLMDASGPGNALDEQMRLLFGSEEITGDQEIKETPGYIDLSEGGTLMVRGAERLAPAIQRKLLDCALSGTFQRLGGTTVHKTRLRIIATTRINPSETSQRDNPLIIGLVKRSISIPPLRHRRKEIPVLAEHYLGRYCHELNKEKARLPKETLSTLINYPWPGNDMELATTLKRAVLVSDGQVLRTSDIYFDLKKMEGRGKFNLLRFGVIRQVLLSPLFPAVLQSAVTPFFLILLALLFMGPSDPMKNPAALFCWSVGWPVLIIGAFFFARFWCSLCPIGTLSRLAKRIISLDLPFPRIIKKRSDFVIAASVIGVIWFETATDIRNSPINLALLLLTMLFSAILVAVLFERQSWCQYLCGLGGMVGIAAKASILELRADQSICISLCRSNECYVGTESREGCPFGQSVPRLDSNRVCKICGICVKNCPHDGIRLNLRIPGKELWEMRRANTGTAFLVIGMISGLLSELLTKTPLYARLSALIPLPDVARFTLVFMALLVTANAVMLLATWCSFKVYGDSFEENYCRHGLGLIPLALTAFVAYHVYYLINLGVHLPMLLSHFLDSSICQKLVITVPPAVTHSIQKLLILAGLAWSLIIIYRLGRASHSRPLPAMVGAIPHALVAIAVALLSLEGIRHSFYG